MPNSQQFIDFVMEMMASSVIAKKMFGGHGLFREGLMFALVVDDQLYFKADEILRNLRTSPVSALQALKTVDARRSSPLMAVALNKSCNAAGAVYRACPSGLQ